MIKAVLLNFEQIGHEEYKTKTYIKEFAESDSIGDITKWVKSIDSSKNITDVYFCLNIKN